VPANKMVIFSVDLMSSFYVRQKRVASAVMRGRWHACLARQLEASGAGPDGKMPSSMAGGNGGSEDGPESDAGGESKPRTARG
jgi:hypothetical protein